MSDSSEYRIGWLGYNEKPNYNRVWGWLEMNDGRKLVFFGVKGKKIEFKPHQDIYNINYLISRMEFKGYEKIKVEHYEEIYPNFTRDMETWLLSAILGSDYRQVYVYKAYYILRRDLNMSSAKMAVQVGHGTDMVHSCTGFDIYMLWKSQDRRKIVLSIKTEVKLNNLITVLREKSILHKEIVDLGLTELDGLTMTGIVILPIEEDKLPKQVQRLQLWRD